MARAFADYLNNRDIIEQKYKRSAERWLKSNTKAKWGFVWCCLMLEISATDIRAEILRKKESGEQFNLDFQKVRR